MTKFFKSKKQVKPIPAALPRTMAELQKEWNEVRNKAAEFQFNIYSTTQNLERLNKRLLEINAEAHAREALDKEEAAKNPPAEQVEAKNDDRA